MRLERTDANSADPGGVSAVIHYSQEEIQSILTDGCHTTSDHLDSNINYRGGRMYCDSNPLRLFGHKLVTSTASTECALSPRKGCMATALGMVDLHEEIILRVPYSRILGVHDQLEQYPCLLC
ncbi:hypothetical protein T03_12263 [Trichinella britovi]|uniref:Uncharacterized protein n=1 Tax=Trichinella britovi TaxID=45882 RepID=A0A0V1CP33_TRIBR|nr:hypothetical protein T03_12263 [Trichinella britovi]